MSSATTAALAMTTVDCADAQKMASFYSALLGWEITASGDGYAMLQGPGQRLGFGEIPDYRSPSWPDEGTKQFHLDLSAEDVLSMADRAVELGATQPSDQPGDGRWVVLLDPAGHPFCITDVANWG